MWNCIVCLVGIYYTYLPLFLNTLYELIFSPAALVLIVIPCAPQLDNLPYLRLPMYFLAHMLTLSFSSPQTHVLLDLCPQAFRAFSSSLELDVSMKSVPLRNRHGVEGQGNPSSHFQGRKSVTLPQIGILKTFFSLRIGKKECLDCTQHDI